MDGKTLARIGAIAFVTLAIVATAIDMRRPADLQDGVATQARAVIEHDPLDSELARCSALGEAGPRDPSCLKTWGQNRRRFLGQALSAAQQPDSGLPLALDANGGR